MTNDCCQTLLGKAIAFLARREHSTLELKQKLQKRGFSVKAIDKVISTLQKKGLQSDERFAEAYVRSKVAAYFGPYRILLELERRGIYSTLIEHYLSMDNVDLWKERLRAAWQKKFGIKPELFSQAYAKQYRFLKQKGFASRHITDFLSGTDNENR